jgi:uridine monophosphate synthetase
MNKSRTLNAAFLLAVALNSNAFSNQTLMQKLYDHEIVKFGSFTLKSGAESSVYVDMRNAISSMDLLTTIATTIASTIENVAYDRICGVPYGAVPIATALALQTRKPLITMRKEIKQYGTQKIIEGTYNEGEKILLIEDVVTTGSSILETLEVLKAHGLVIEDIVVLLDREQGGVQRLQELGYTVHVVMTLSDLFVYRERIHSLS